MRSQVRISFRYSCFLEPNLCPDFMSSERPKSRQARFARFSKEAVKTLESLPRDASLPLILLTGGLRTPELLLTALSMRHAQLLGIGRSSVLSPDLPTLLQDTGPTQASWSEPFRPEPELSADASSLRWLWKYLPSIPLLGAGVETAYYVVTMRALATSGPRYPAASRMGGLTAVFWMWVWVDRATVWAALSLASLALIAGIAVVYY